MHRSFTSAAPAPVTGSDPTADEAAENSGVDADTDRGGLKRWLLGPYLSHPRQWSAHQIGFVLISGIALLYLSLYHPYWTRGGDSELYLAIARHLARGEGYRYNGQPVGLVPPGWPLLLAGGMWLTSNIALLKLILLGSMLTFFASAFHVLRRYATPWWSAAAVFAVAICQPTWQLSMWFLAEAPFLAASWLALVLAVQARERHAAAGGAWAFWWRVSAALVLLAAAVSMRWTGALWGIMLGLALLDGRRLTEFSSSQQRRGGHPWIAAGLCVSVGFATFFVLRQSLKVDPAMLDPRYATFEAGEYELINQTDEPTAATYLQRLLATPQWISVLFWTLLARAGALHAVMSFIALLSLLLMCAGAWVGLKRRQWLWLGAGLVWLPIILTWPGAIARYTLPVAPLLILAAIAGTAAMLRWLDRPALPRLLRLAPVWLMAPAALVLVVYNVGVLGLEAWGARDPVNRFESGTQRQLTAIGHFLRGHHETAHAGELAVANVRAYNGVRLASMGPRRKVVWLADRNAIDVPMPPAHEPRTSADPSNELDPDLLDWLRQRNVRWYVTTMMQRRLLFLSWPGPPAGDDWRLYEITPDDVRRVDLGDQPDEVMFVPGLEDAPRLGGA